MPLFSIIVPIYNVEEYLDKCVCSILNQTFSDFELILVDDGSPDNCPKLCDEYEKKDSRIKVVHKENGGLSSARNAGLDIATGKYIYFVDSDDYIKQNLLETVIPYLNNEIDLVIFQQDIVKIDKSIKACNSHETGIFEFQNAVELRNFIISKLLTCSFGWEAWNRIFVRDLIEKYNIRFADNKKIFAEDLYFSLCYCAHIKKFISIQESLYCYLIRNDSIMGKDKKKLNIGRYNELSKAVFEFYLNCKDCNILVDDFSIIHYMICRNDIKADISIDLASVSDWRRTFLSNILDKDFFITQTSKLKKYKNELKNIIGGSNAELAVSYMQYLKDANYFSLRFRNHIIYKHMDYLDMNTEQMKELEQQYKTIENKKRIFFLGSEEFGNIGDHQINEIIISFLKTVLPEYYVFEVTTREWNKNKIFLKKYIKEDDIIVLPGGGNFGDNYKIAQNRRNEIICLWPQNHKIVFPQTVYFSDTEGGYEYLENTKALFCKENNVILFLREKQSYEYAKNEFTCECELTPDIVLFSDYSEYPERKNKVLFCLRSDIEKSLSDKDIKNLKNLCISYGEEIENTDLQLNYYLKKTERRKIIDEKLNLWKSSKLVITDRLHGMVFAAITGTPCIVFSNYNHKVKGTYEWIKYLPYIRYAETFEDAEKYLPELLSMENCTYDNTPLMPYFEKLAEVVKSYAKN